jgi:hypothetical protein
MKMKTFNLFEPNKQPNGTPPGFRKIRRQIAKKNFSRNSKDQR